MEVKSKHFFKVKGEKAEQVLSESHTIGEMCSMQCPLYINK